jgi:hypothetical protein
MARVKIGRWSGVNAARRGRSAAFMPLQRAPAKGPPEVKKSMEVKARIGDAGDKPDLLDIRWKTSNGRFR